jgi:hypothetical protein
MFSFIVPPSNLSSSAVFRLDPASSFGPVGAGDTSTCHDISTLLPERLPLAANAPTSCGPDAQPIVMSPMSTLMTIPGVSYDVIRDAFDLPSNSPAVGTADILRRALDGDTDALIVMRREIQIKNLVSQLAWSITSNDAAYSRIARACFRALGLVITPPVANANEPSNAISKRRALLQSQEMNSLAAIFEDLYATVASDPEIDISDIAFIENDTMVAVMISIANFNDLSDAITGSVDDVYRLAILVQTEILPSIQRFIAGNTTMDDFVQSSSLEHMTMSFEQTSLPEGSVRDPLSHPNPAPENSQPEAVPQESVKGSSTSLKLGLGLGLGLGIPVILACGYYYVSKKKRERSKSAIEDTPFAPQSRPKGSKVLASSRADITASPVRSPDIV